MARFKLDPVLKVRQLQEKKHKSDLFEIKVIRENAEKVLEDLEAQKEKQMEDLEVEDKIRALDLQMQYAYLNSLAKQVETQRTTLEKILKEEEKKRGELVKVNQDKKMMEKLKEKFIGNILKETQKREQLSLDAISQRTTLNK
jgi:flagellar export protein FliJ